MALVHEIGEYVSGARLSVDFLLRSTAQLCSSVVLLKTMFFCCLQWGRERNDTERNIL